MYPILLKTYMTTCLRKFPTFGDKVPFTYPPEALRDGFQHLPLLSFCRTQAMAAIRETGALKELSREDLSMVRWRISMPEEHNWRISDLYESRLELFIGEPDKLALVYSCPVVGPEFDKLPLVLRLGIEMLIRKECDGADPE